VLHHCRFLRHGVEPQLYSRETVHTVLGFIRNSKLELGRRMMVDNESPQNSRPVIPAVKSKAFSL